MRLQVIFIAFFQLCYIEFIHNYFLKFHFYVIIFNFFLFFLIYFFSFFGLEESKLIWRVRDE